MYPLTIKSMQTDNGSEFLGDFDEYLKSRMIPHYFSYPRCPKINGCVERYNSTLKEEFVYNNIDVIDLWCLENDFLNILSSSMQKDLIKH